MSKKVTKRTKKTSINKKKRTSSSNSIDRMKYEIANEFGVKLGPDASSKDNGRVGGEITKRLIEKGLKK
ncbi:MAG: alpha/beta-type small acid-soluble spore protein [Bacilli bacterium]|nr:alpha/beta-type small acid-soluble spore protein [Bacilli bacterium]